MDYKHTFLLDDNDTTNFCNVEVIKDCPLLEDVSTFTRPDSFLEFFISSQEVQQQKSLLLLDINMPDKSGYEVIEELEELDNVMDELDIIMLSSSSMSIDIEKATRYPNVIGYIEKPLTLEKLDKILTGDFSSDKEPRPANLSYCNLRLLNSNTIICSFTTDTHYTLDMANEMFDACNALSPAAKYNLITVMHKKLKPQKEVFDFYSDPKRKEKILAEAFCLNSTSLKLMANFYFRVKRPEINSAVFETETEALEWLNKLS